MRSTASKASLLLPRGYISWSQLDLIETNERGYCQKYFEGKERVSNISEEFGSEIGLIMEGQDTDDPIAELLRATIVRYKHPEFEMHATMKSQGKDIPLFGKLDSYDGEPEHSIEEYKTGKIPWSQKKAEKHGQPLFYATMVYLREKVIPQKIGLTWAETEEYWAETEYKIALTGKVERYPLTYTENDVLKMMGRIAKGAKRIDALYREHLQSLT